jgi:hypothetical protein
MINKPLSFSNEHNKESHPLKPDLSTIGDVTPESNTMNDLIDFEMTYDPDFIITGCLLF